MRTALDAQVSSELIRKAVRQKPLVQYPNSELSRQLQMVASMIRAGLPTRVYYVQHGGFDTHAQQGGANGRHANLLGQLSQSIKAFYADLKAQENDGRVLTIRKATTPEPEHRKIYATLRIPSEVIPPVKTWRRGTISDEKNRKL